MLPAYKFLIGWFLCSIVTLILALVARKLYNWDRNFWDMKYIEEIYGQCLRLGPFLLPMGIVTLIANYKHYDTKEKYVLRKFGQ